MGLFMTLEGLTEEDAVRLASEEAVPADRLRVFDLHCDTLDRLAFHGDASVPGGFAAHDARIPAHRMATLADNDAHVSLARTGGFAWCQCLSLIHICTRWNSRTCRTSTCRSGVSSTLTV